MLYNQILKITETSIYKSEAVRVGFLKRLEERRLTRDENPQSHFCIYFLPFDQQAKKVFIVHHKKSGLWLAPGGHVDQDEGLLETLNREINEELGVENFFQQLPSPFLLTITPIENKNRSCKIHYDIWYTMNTDGSDFTIDTREFYNTKWLTISEAEKIVTEKRNRKALKLLY